MRQLSPPAKAGSTDREARLGAWGFCLLAGVLILLLGLIHAHRHSQAMRATQAAGAAAPAAPANSPQSEPARRRPRSFASQPGPAPTAEEIVAGKVAQFGRNRREIARLIARRSGKPVSAEVERFFDAVDSGRWEDIKAQWDALAKRSGQYEHSTNHWEDLDPFWASVLDAYGVAEQAHIWPAQKLLDYGNSVLGALRPGMVLVGGTDNGRWIPELLSETADGEQHIVITQNAMADARYVDFMNTLYGERMTGLTSEDSQRAFAEYTADAQKRLEHDQQFPDEPKQLLPGEDLQLVDGKLQVRGVTAVMAINGKLLQTLMRKNPDLSFAIQESYPLKDTYADALPLGPLMELGAAGSQEDFTPDAAAQSLDYWRKTAGQVLAESPTPGSEPELKSYAHDAVAAANLLAAHNYAPEAEEAYRLAAQLWPASGESVCGLAALLAGNGRQEEAQQLLDDFARKYPDQRKEVENQRATLILGTAQR